MSELNGWTTKEILIDFRDEMRREFVKMREAQGDHETRIRSTESSISRVKGAMALLVIVVPAVAALAAVFIH